MKRAAIAEISPWSKKIAALCLALLVAVLMLQIFTTAPASSQTDSRVSRLESEVYSLRSQLSRLESQVYQLNNRSQPPTSRDRRSQIPPEPALDRPVKPTEPTFQRLATIVIELQERITEIEKRLSNLESQSSLPSPKLHI